MSTTIISGDDTIPPEVWTTVALDLADNERPDFLSYSVGMNSVSSPHQQFNFRFGEKQKTYRRSITALRLGAQYLFQIMSVNPNSQI
jgi:hypothetical protein